jgi:bacterioferritin
MTTVPFAAKVRTAQELLGEAGLIEKELKSPGDTNNARLEVAHETDSKRVIWVLNERLAAELVCVLRYKRHFYTADAMNARSAAEEFLQLAAEESDHADMIAERIQQLGGEPNFDPKTLMLRSRSDCDVAGELEAMIHEDLAAKLDAIGTYAEIINWLGDDDPTTRRMLQHILTTEKEHAEDMLGLLAVAKY